VQLPEDSEEKYFGYDEYEAESPCVDASDESDLEGQKNPAPKAFTRQVILAIVAYGILA
jgi:hypothetical protein